MNTTFLSTGEAAKIHSVTPDTILKWIKSGKLSAHRTAGGHYRIHPRELKKFLSTDQTSPGTKQQALPQRIIQYCWEYNGKGELPEACPDCVVYQMRAQRCYEVLRISPEIGHRKTFCLGGCRACDYFHRVIETATGVLFVTNDEVLAALLRRDTGQPRYRLEIADCGYTCSSLVEAFRPDYIVIDCSLGPDAVRHICRHVTEDTRIPCVRVILAAEKGGFPEGCDRDVFARIEKPFRLEAITECVLGAAADQ